MAQLRPPAVAGVFYPADPTELSDLVDSQLTTAATVVADSPTCGDEPADSPHLDAPPAALIVPHAGYIYSGTTAALAYAGLRRFAGTIRRVLLLGPTHRVAIRGLATCGATAFQTPLGLVPVEEISPQQRAALPQIVDSPQAHAQEHSLEVHVPFLQEVLGEFTLIPLAVGTADPEQVCAVLDQLGTSPHTLIVVSSDLSHFLPQAQARATDDATLAQILDLDGSLTHEQACGATPVNGLLLHAQRRGLRPRLLGACTSGDTAGDPRRVVGYASVAFDDPTAWSARAGSILLDLARQAIARELGVDTAPPTTPHDAQHDAGHWLTQPGACFVTVTHQGTLRGCIGTVEAWRPLGEDVQANAVAAAVADRRFPPLSAAELPATDLEVSVLSTPQPIPAGQEAEAIAAVRPGVDGLLLRHEERRATFLPQVWQRLPDPSAFLAALRRKAGLPEDFWDPNVQLSRYTVTSWQGPADPSADLADRPATPASGENP